MSVQLHNLMAWALARDWPQPQREHDPLCVTPQLRATGCVGCLLVELRSDATYLGGDKGGLARLALTELAASAQAHLDHTLERK